MASFKKLWKNIVKADRKRVRRIGAALGVVNKNYVFDFGKYAGESAKEILKHNPSYLLWVHNNLSNITFDPTFLKKVKVAAMEESEAFNRSHEIVRGGHWQHALPEYDNWAGDEEDLF